MKNHTHIIGLLEERISFNDPSMYVNKLSIDSFINDSTWIPYELVDTLTFKEINDLYTNEKLKKINFMFIMPMDRNNKDFIVKGRIITIKLKIENENMSLDQYIFKYLCENLHKMKEDDLIYIAHFLEKYICSYEEVLEIFKTLGVSENHKIFQKRHDVAKVLSKRSNQLR